MCHVLNVMQEEALEAEVRSSIVSHMVVVHQSVRTFSARFQEQLRRSNYVTPKNYLDFIHNYKHALADNRTNFSAMAARLDGGLQKLIQVFTCLQLLGNTQSCPAHQHHHGLKCIQVVLVDTGMLLVCALHRRRILTSCSIVYVIQC